MNKRVHDDSFRKIAVDLANSRGSIKEVAEELGINQSLLNKWKYWGSGSKQNTVRLTEE